MEAQLLNNGGGPTLYVGAMPARPGAVTAGWHPEADVPFRIGEALAAADGSVAHLVVDDSVARVPLPTRVHFLLECRRVLFPGGDLRLGVDDPDQQVGEDALPNLALMTGLEVAPGGAGGVVVDGALRFVKPDRRVTGDPLVSIAIPAHNPQFFAAAFESALAQTYDPIEVVVCDDSPGTEIEAMARRAERRTVRYERNLESRGARGNFVRCLESAEGEFVKFLCDDDLLGPTCVERLVDGFRRAPDVTLATSSRLRVDMRGLPLPDQPATVPIVAHNTLVAGYTLASAMLMLGLNTIGEPSTALFRKSDFAASAPDYFRFRGATGRGVIDMVMWSSLLLKGNAVYLTDRLSSFRVHPGQRQHDPRTQQRSVASIRELQAAWLALGLHELLPPDLLLAKPFPPQEGGWESRRITGYAARRA